MKKAIFLVACVLFLFTGVTNAVTNVASIPHPRLLWNQTWQDQWEQAKNTNNAWWLRVKEYADLAVAGTARYQDGGIYPSIAYQVTKDPKYALAAYNIFMKYPEEVLTTMRLLGHYVIQVILVYDWMYNGLTTEQKQNAMDRIIQIGEIFTKPDCLKNGCLLRIGRPAGGYIADSDETTFMYFYLALLEQVLEGESPKAGTFLNASPVDIYGMILPIGGLDYSGTGGMPPAYALTLRDAIYHYGVNSLGGSWIESCEYNRSTFKAVLLSYQALKQITGQDHFPEYTRIMPDSAAFVFHEITPDMEQSYDWNDNEQPRSMNDPWARELMGWINTMMALAGINRDSDIGANLNKLIEELRVKYPTTAYSPLTGMGLMGYYPMDSKKDWRTTLPKGFLAVGMGHFRYKTGWNKNDSLFGAQMTTRVNVDHSVEYMLYSDPQGKHGYFGHFQLYRKGKWAITAPEGYGNQTGSMRNAMEIGGIPTMWELGPIANEWTDNYAYVAGLTQKTPDPPGSWNRKPDSFCNEWTRSVFYLPTVDKSGDSIVIYDRVSSDQTKAWFFHTQEQATYQSGVATWNITNANSLPQPALSTSGTQKGQLTILSPQDITTSVYPDPPGNTGEIELKYTFKVTPSTSQTWNTFLNVVDVYDQGTAPLSSKITSVSGSKDLVEGVKITRVGQNDALVLFGANAFPASRILSKGYSVTFDIQASNNTADVYFLDLSKAREWTVKIDNDPVTFLAINNKGIGTGVGNVTVTGAGSHTITLDTTQIDLYTLTKSVNPINGGTISASPDKASYTEGTTVTLTATPNTGYTFVNWSGNISGTTPSITITIDDDKNVIANFTNGQAQLSREVNPSDAGTISVSPEKTNYSVGEMITLTAKPNTCYNFTGWSNDASGTTPTTTITMNTNKKVTANFSKYYYMLTINATNGTITKNPSKSLYLCGETVTLTATPSINYSFASWSGDITGTTSIVTIVINKNKNVTANFITQGQQTYTLSMTAIPTNGGAISVSPNKVIYSAGEIVVLAAIPNNGYSFGSWSGDISGTTSNVTVTLNANMSVTANFITQQTQTYTLSMTAIPTNGGAISVSPNKTTYSAGEIVALTATPNNGYSFGSWAGDISGTTSNVTVTLNANMSVTANFTKNQTNNACQIFPPDNIWNTRVDDLAVAPNSLTYVNTIGAATVLHPDFGSESQYGANMGIPYNDVSGTQAKASVSFTWPDESDAGPYPIPSNPLIEGGTNSTGDRHVLVVDRDNCILYELYNAFANTNGTWRADSGAIFDLKSNALRPKTWTSADAAGLPIFPGLVKYDEVASGEIKHAIRFTVPKTRRAYVWPARHYASTLTDTIYPPMGQRFRLKASFAITGFTPEATVILTALKKYGMILSDNGNAWFISGVADDRWNNDAIVGDLRKVHGSDFEAVDVSPLMINEDSGQVKSSSPQTCDDAVMKERLKYDPDGDGKIGLEVIIHTLQVITN